MEDYWNYSNYFCHHMKNPNLAWIWISNKSYVKIFKKHFFTNIIGHGQKEHKKTHGIRLKKSLNKRNQFHRSFFFYIFPFSEIGISILIENIFFSGEIDSFHFTRFFLPEVLKILWLAIFQAWSLWDTSFFLARTFKNSLAGDIPGLVILGGGASSKILSLLSSPELSELLEELSSLELSSLELENGH